MAVEMRLSAQSVTDASWFVRGVFSATRVVDVAIRDGRLRRTVKAAVDFCCAAGAVALALALSDGLTPLGGVRATLLAGGVGLLVVTAVALSGSHRAIWRYTSLREAIALALSSVTVFAALVAADALHLAPITPATALLIALLMLASCVGVRALRRWYSTEMHRRERLSAAPDAGTDRRVLIAGAGEHGLSIGREMAYGGMSGLRLVGFLDDDPAKQGAALNGARVLGPLADALAIAARERATDVIVAMPSADFAVVRNFVRRIEGAGLRVRAIRGVERFVRSGDAHRPGSATLDELVQTAPGSGRRSVDGRRRVLVMGGAGYIGSHLVRMLLQRGYAVRILDRFDYGRSGIAGLENPALEVVPGDICSSRDVGRALRGVDGVIALAAIVGDPACNLDPEETVNLNYTATKILVEACNFYGVRRLVFASSCSVYGASDQGLLTEQSRLNPVSLYARTRVLSESIVFDRAGAVEPVVLRLSTVFGLSPRMRFDLVVNTLTVRAIVDGKISIFGGNQWRPNVHCRDAARAFLAAFEAPAAAVAGEVFNVGGEALNHRIAELGAMVAQAVGDVQVLQQQEAADPRDYRVSFEKIRRVLQFEPEVTVAAGIREVADAIRADPRLRDYQNPTYHNVQALKETFVRPRRRRGDLPPARELAGSGAPPP